MRDGKTVIAFDAGGVLTKFPHKFRPLVNALLAIRHIEVLVISDQHDSDKLWQTLNANGYHFGRGHIHAANYQDYGEECKAHKCVELRVDFLIDDFPGYCAAQVLGSQHVSLFVWPRPDLDYYAPDFLTDGSEGNFGRRPGQNPMKDPAGEERCNRAGTAEETGQLADWLRESRIAMKNLAHLADGIPCQEQGASLACALGIAHAVEKAMEATYGPAE